MKLKENDYICGTCKHYDCVNLYCELMGEYGYEEDDACLSWTDPEEVELTDEEKREIIGDRKAHERMETEGRIK